MSKLGEFVQAYINEQNARLKREAEEAKKRGLNVEVRTYTYEEIAKAAGFNKSIVFKLLNNENYSPSPKTLERLGEALQVDAHVLFDLALGRDVEVDVLAEQLVARVRQLSRRDRAVANAFLDLLLREQENGEENGESEQPIRA